jgi:hypothetical protein
MIPAFGWKSMLILGGVLPLLVAPLLYFKLPESVTFLVARRRTHVSAPLWKNSRRASVTRNRPSACRLIR